MDPTRKITSFTRSDTRTRNSPKSSVSSGIPSCQPEEPVRAEQRSERFCAAKRASYVVRVQLAVPRQTVQESLDVGSEDGVQRRVVDLIQMFSQTVPEVEGDLHHLNRRDHSHPLHILDQTEPSRTLQNTANQSTWNDPKNSEKAVTFQKRTSCHLRLRGTHIPEPLSVMEGHIRTNARRPR